MKIALQRRDVESAAMCRTWLLLGSGFLFTYGLLFAMPCFAQERPANEQPANDTNRHDDKERRELNDRLQEILLRLESPSIQRRDEAEAELIALGPHIVDRLARLVDTVDGESRVRIIRVAQQLRQQRTDQWLLPSRITLNESLTLTQWAEAVADQTGNQLAGLPDDDRQYPFDADEQTFWEAIDALKDKANVRLVVPQPRDGKLHLEASVPSEDESGVIDTSMHQAFFLTASTPRLVGEQRAPGDQDAAGQDPEPWNIYQLSIFVNWEPRLQPITVSLPLAELNARDEQDRALRAQRADAILQTPLHPRQIQVPFTIPLLAPPGSVKTSVEGNLELIIPGPDETFDLALDARQAPQDPARQGNIRLIVWEVFRSGPHYIVRLEQQSNFEQASEVMASHAGWPLRWQAQLIDGDAVHDAESIQISPRGQNVASVWCHFGVDQVGEDARIVLRLPTTFRTITVPFRFEDIPLTE